MGENSPDHLVHVRVAKRLPAPEGEPERDAAAPLGKLPAAVLVEDRHRFEQQKTEDGLAIQRLQMDSDAHTTEHFDVEHLKQLMK